jgi:hypothetical protein
MRRKFILLVAIVSAVALAACDGLSGLQASESAAQVSESASGEANQTETGTDVSGAGEAGTGSSETISVTPEPATPEPATPEPATPEPATPTPDPWALPGQPFRDPGPDPTPIPDDPVAHGYNKIELSGNRDDRFLTTEYCYLRSDKYVMFFEKDLSIPGDFKEKVDLVVDEVEKTVGLPFNYAYYVPEKIYYDYWGYNPWQGIALYKRIAIFVLVDREDVAYVSSANGEIVNVFEYDLYSDEFWNSVPSYRDNAWRRRGFFDYEVVAHELTHVLTDRYANMTWAMTEGMADYVAEVIMERLQDTSEDFKKSYEYMYVPTKIAKKVTPENAEAIFVDDFSDYEMVDRTDVYTFGRMFCEFLGETYGEGFMRDYILATERVSKNLNYGNMTQEDRQMLADKIKEIFGDDVFTNFGAWYQTHAK